MGKIKNLLLLLILVSFVCSCSTLSSMVTYTTSDDDSATFLSRVSNVEANFMTLSLSLILTTSNLKFSSTGEQITITSTSIFGESTTSVYNFVGLTSSTRGIYEHVSSDGTVTYCGIQLTSSGVAYIYIGIGISVSNKNLVFLQPSYEFDVPTEDEVLSGGSSDDSIVDTVVDDFLIAVKNKTAYVTILDVKHGLVFSSDGTTITFTSAFTSGGTVKLSYEGSSSSTTATYKITSSSVSGYNVGNTITVIRTTSGGTFNGQVFVWN